MAAWVVCYVLNCISTVKTFPTFPFVDRYNQILPSPCTQRSPPTDNNHPRVEFHSHTPIWRNRDLFPSSLRACLTWKHHLPYRRAPQIKGTCPFTQAKLTTIFFHLVDLRMRSNMIRESLRLQNVPDWKQSKLCHQRKLLCTKSRKMATCTPIRTSASKLVSK